MWKDCNFAILCIVIIAIFGFTVVTINRAQCIDKFDSVFEIKQCMEMIK